MDGFPPRFVWGVINPRNAEVVRGGAYQFYQLVPRDVMIVDVRLGIADYGRDEVETAIERFRRCVDLLAAEHVNAIVLAGAPISAQLGRARVIELLSEVEQRVGVPAYAPLEAMVAAVKHLGLERVAVASRWADEVNSGLAGYLRAGGLNVVGVTTRGQWNREAHAMTLEQGMDMALDVAREAIRIAPGAQAILAPGGATLTLHVIPAVEQESGVPVITNLSAEVWTGLIRTGVIEPLQGWGKLLGSRP